MSNVFLKSKKHFSTRTQVCSGVLGPNILQNHNHTEEYCNSPILTNSVSFKLELDSLNVGLSPACQLRRCLSVPPVCRHWECSREDHSKAADHLQSCRLENPGGTKEAEGAVQETQGSSGLSVQGRRQIWSKRHGKGAKVRISGLVHTQLSNSPPQPAFWKMHLARN